jgi:hypothetical protein
MLVMVEGPANVPCASLDIICSAGFKERNGYVDSIPLSKIIEAA